MAEASHLVFPYVVLVFLMANSSQWYSNANGRRLFGFFKELLVFSFHTIRVCIPVYHQLLITPWSQTVYWSEVCYTFVSHPSHTCDNEHIGNTAYAFCGVCSCMLPFGIHTVTSILKHSVSIHSQKISCDLATSYPPQTGKALCQRNFGKISYVYV